MFSTSVSIEKMKNLEQKTKYPASNNVVGTQCRFHILLDSDGFFIAHEKYDKVRQSVVGSLLR